MSVRAAGDSDGTHADAAVLINPDKLVFVLNKLAYVWVGWFLGLQVVDITRIYIHTSRGSARVTPFLVPRCCCGSCPPRRAVTTHNQASSTPPSTGRQFLRAARSKALLSRWRQHHRVPVTKSFCISHRHGEPWALPPRRRWRRWCGMSGRRGIPHRVRTRPRTRRAIYRSRRSTPATVRATAGRH